MSIDASPAVIENRDPASLGLRPITRWVPNTRDPAFLERYRQQRAAIAMADSDIEWWERTQSDEGWV